MKISNNNNLSKILIWHKLKDSINQGNKDSLMRIIMIVKQKYRMIEMQKV
jgi:hypothetical protein